MSDKQKPQLSEEEEQSLEQAFDEALDLPMFILSIVMIILLIVELAVDLSPTAQRTVILAGSIIWWVFVLEYVIRVFLAENRKRFIKTHLLDAIFILVPFLRVLRIFRIFRTVRFLRVVKPTTIGRTYVTTRRGLRELAETLGKRSFPYVVGATIVVVLIGALMLYLVERNAPGAVIHDFGASMWWTVGTLTTIGTELYPVTAEGRILATILMVYGVAIFGYIAGTLASYFVQLDTLGGHSVKPINTEQMQEIKRLSDKIEQMLAELKEHKSGNRDSE